MTHRLAQRLFTLLLLTSLGTALGCNSGRAVEEMPPSDDAPMMTGTIQYIDLEGGFYGLLGDDGKKYLPLNLANDFEEDGLRVRFEAEVAEGVMTLQQWGTPVRLTTITRL